MSEPGATLAVEVVFATPERQELLDIEVAPGTSVGEAIRQSGIADRFPGVGFEDCAVGIWGRPVERDRVLQYGDRVEIYRPLAMDPREARRQLAAHGGAMGQKDGG